MKVLFDTQIFDWQINGGISRYFIEVLNRLRNDPEVEVMFKCRHSYNTYIQSTHWLASRPILKSLHFKGKLGLLKVVNQQINRPWSNRQLRKGKADIFHPTYYDPYFLKILGKQKMVLTVYDLTNEKFNDQTALTQKVLGWKKHLIERADHIIAISENTRKDVIEYYHADPAKVSTVYLSGGFDKWILDAPLKPEIDQLNKPYILFVGSRGKYKNFNAFVKEAAPILIREDLHLVLAGGGAISANEHSLIKELGLAERVKAYAHVSDSMLAQLYKVAILFIFPSLYEGFGLPVLEAMQCGCPALLSNNSSLPEVGGSAGAYFDPQAPGALAHTLSNLLQDESRRQQMITDGYQQATLFNWERTSAGHRDVYKKLLG